jgi:hypothetical protein
MEGLRRQQPRRLLIFTAHAATEAPAAMNTYVNFTWEPGVLAISRCVLVESLPEDEDVVVIVSGHLYKMRKWTLYIGPYHYECTNCYYRESMLRPVLP